MTCIIGFPYAHGWVLAGDRCAMDATSHFTRTRKVFRVDKCAFGGAGLIAHIQHIARAWAGSSEQSADTLASLVAQGIGGKSIDGTDFLIVDESGISHVDSSGAICAPSKHGIAIGSGGDYAAGFLHGVLRKGLPATPKAARALARECLRYTSAYAIGVSGPYDVFIIGV